MLEAEEGVDKDEARPVNVRVETGPLNQLGELLVPPTAGFEP